MYVDEATAVALLNSGEIVALPTETVYGLAARFDLESALKKVFKIKQRPSFDPLIVHISHTRQLVDLTTHVTPVETFLMDRFWPGPLTMILPKHSNVSEIITSGLDTVAVRMPKNQAFLDIIQQTAPLAAPSANLFGHTSPTLSEHVEFEFGGKLPVFDGGPCSVGIESTVVQITESANDLQLSVLRPGMLSHQEITRALKDYSDKHVRVAFGATAASPGHVQDHYQPRAPLVVARGTSTWTTQIHSEICKTLHLADTAKPALLSYILEEPTIVARTLYSDLREQSDSGCDYIYLTIPDAFFMDEWRAIRDRIQKASKYSITERDGHITINPKLDNFH